MKSPLLLLTLFCVAALALSAAAPLDATLGESVRMVYLHGAIVWAALFSIAAAALCGAIGLLARRPTTIQWSKAWGRAGLLLWLLNVPMSLYVMQANWNGLYTTEPRFRFAVVFGVAGLLLQSGLAFLPRVWTAAGNLGFGVLLLAVVLGAPSVMHPDSPVFTSDSQAIRAYFVALLVLLGLAAWQLARMFYRAARQ